MIIFDREITAQRWPWQDGYNWHGMLGSSAPLNQPRPGEKAAPRFGGGWKYKLGIQFSSSRYILIEFLYGTVTISKAQKCAHCGKRIARRDQGRGIGRVFVSNAKTTVQRDQLHWQCIDELGESNV